MENKKYYLVYFFVYFSWASIVSLMPVYLNENIGMEVAKVGFFMSVIPILNLIFQPIWGGIADYINNRILILRILLIMTAILSLLIGIIESKAFTLIIFSLYTIFMCGQGPIKDSVTLGYVSSIENSSFGVIRAFGAIGFAFGAFGAGFIAEGISINWIFYLASIGFFIAFFLINRIENINFNNSKEKYRKSIKSLINNKVYIFILVYAFFFIGVFFGSDQFHSLFVRHNGFNMNIVGFLLFIAVCVEIPFIFFSNKLMNRYGLLKLLIFMSVVSILRLFYLGISSTFFDFLITGILRGISVGIFIPLFIELIAKITSPKILSSAISIYTAISAGIGVVVFTFLGGLIIDKFDYKTLFWFYAIIQSLLLVPLFLNIRKLKKI